METSTLWASRFPPAAVEALDCAPHGIGWQPSTGRDAMAEPREETIWRPIAWPELMRRETAAAYLDMTPQQFDRNCRVAAVDLGMRAHRWKKAKLDAWIAALDERGKKPSDEPAPEGTAEGRRAASLARIRAEAPRPRKKRILLADD